MKPILRRAQDERDTTKIKIRLLVPKIETKIGIMQGKYVTMLVVIYDSVFNSVFESQVLRPLLVKLGTNPLLHITLVSFEPDVLRAQQAYANTHCPKLKPLISGDYKDQNILRVCMRLPRVIRKISTILSKKWYTKVPVLIPAILRMT